MNLMTSQPQCFSNKRIGLYYKYLTIYITNQINQACLKILQQKKYILTKITKHTCYDNISSLSHTYISFPMCNHRYHCVSE